jgi:CRP-like cAMP-binding protein
MIANRRLVRPIASGTVPSRPPPSANKLLAALPPGDYLRILPSLRNIPIKFKQVLQKQGEKVSNVYFPSSCVCSIVNVMKDGRMVEVATVGNEGMIGITAFLGGDLPPGETFVQVPVPDGASQVMSVAAFREEVDRHGPFQDVMNRYAQALTAMIMQSTACNGLHSVEERCARWLLMTHDRVGFDEFQLTQEFLAIMLGVRRPSVTIVMGALHKAGVIEYGKRMTRVVNREGLEAMSCECYSVVKGHFDRLLPQRR